MNKLTLSQLVNKYTNKDADMKLFIEELTEYYASKYNVPNCQIKIVPFDDVTGHKTHPAFYKRAEKTIYFRNDVLECGDIGRIIKLTSHEWMHYYVDLFETGEIKQKDLVQQYKTLILEAKNDVSCDLDILMREYSKAYTKLSVSETVADNFAQDVLRDLREAVKDKNLIKCFDNQINNHNRQITEMRQIIENNPEFNAFVQKLKSNKK